KDPENDSGYRLTINPDDRTFLLRRWDDGKPVELMPWTNSDAIRGGAQNNRVELGCQGSTISARINGMQVASVQDSTYREGRLWMGAGAFSGQPSRAEARFKSLIVMGRSAAASPTAAPVPPTATPIKKLSTPTATPNPVKALLSDNFDDPAK